MLKIYSFYGSKLSIFYAKNNTMKNLYHLLKTNLKDV